MKIPKGVIITTLIVLPVLIGITFAFLRYNKPNTSTPTIHPKTEVKTQLSNNFIILPNDFEITENEKEILSTISPDTIYLDTRNPEGKTLNINSITIKNIGSEDITKCQISAQSVPQETANATLKQYKLQTESCDVSKTQFIEVYEVSCTVIDSSCFETILGLYYLPNTYIYFPQNPLIFITYNREIEIEEKYYYGNIMIWDDIIPNTMEQVAYSIEILQNNKRVYSSGKINAQNIGDFYFPTAKIENTQLKAKLRLWLKYQNLNIESPLVVETDFAFNTQDKVENQSNSKILEMSWIPSWGIAEGIKSVQNNPKKWNTISPVWFTPNKDGTLNKEATFNNSTLISLTKKNKIKLIPTISTFDADITSSILNKNLDKHVKEIVKLVVNNNYDGIDLDYESTYKTDKELLSQFIQKLAVELHTKNKILSFTVLPKIDDREIYSFLPQTHQAQDWSEIGKHVDEFRIMAYDFTGQGSARPGPLSPINWNKALIEYAISKMPKEKVVLSLPLYSHAWPKPSKSDLTGENNDKNLSTGLLKNTLSWQHDDIAYIKRHSLYYKESYDNWNKEMYATLSYNKVERVMYYLDSKAVTERKNLVAKYGIKGVCYWRIGGEKL